MPVGGVSKSEQVGVVQSFIQIVRGIICWFGEAKDGMIAEIINVLIFKAVHCSVLRRDEARQGRTWGHIVQPCLAPSLLVQYTASFGFRYIKPSDFDNIPTEKTLNRKIHQNQRRLERLCMYVLQFCPSIILLSNSMSYLNV